MTRQSLVAANWKMYGTWTGVNNILATIKQGLAQNAGGEVAIFPPFVYLAKVARLLHGTKITSGAQDICSVTGEGAHTGEVSGVMLRDVGCRYVIVGHSERRTLYGETDTMVARKFFAAQEAGLVPILCVGEQLDERESEQTEAVIARQLDVILEHPGGVASLAKAVIAYEPVWAIGTGKTATPAQAQAVHAFIRGKIAAHDQPIAEKIRILYGGSVKSTNAADLFAMPDIDGGLIGGASLDAPQFLEICRAAR